jgi:hypothetical protein
VTEESDGEPWPIQSTEFLELIPADTPYVLAQSEPIPADVVKKLKPFFDPFVARIDKALAEEHAKAKPEDARTMEEIFGGKPSFAGIENMGVDLNPRFVIYGLGFAPVTRMRLKDAAALDRTFDKLETTSEKPSKISTFHGQRYRYSQSEDGSLTVFAIVGPDLVIAILPPGDIQRDLLPLVFGQKLPSTSMAKDDRIAKLRAQHGFTPHFTGYIDVHEVVAAIMGVGGELNRRVAAAYPSLANTRSPECIDEAMKLARAMPRIEFGYDEFSTKRIAASGVLKLEPAIAQHTKRVAGPIPGLSAKPTQGSIATFGMGFDMKAVQASAMAYAAAVKAEPFRCADFKSLNELGEMVAQAPALIPAPLMGVTGMGVDVTGVVLEAGGDPRVEGVTVLGLDDPKGALDAVGKLVPTLDLGKLKKSRTPVKVMSLMPAGGGPPPPALEDAWVAVGRRSIGLSLGKAGKRDLLKALDRQRPGNRELAVWTFDLAPLVARHPEAFPTLPDPDTQKLAEAMLALLGRTSFIVRTTDHGIETEMTLALPKR